MRRTYIFGTLLTAVTSSVLIACTSGGGGGASSSSPSVSTALSEAVTYMESALPDVSDGSVAYHQFKKFMNVASNLILPRLAAASYSLDAVWDSSAGAEKIQLPGGMGSGCGEPSYLGSAMPSSVNFEDFVGMSLDVNYERCSSGGGNYKPTVFGRFSNATDILGYLDSFLAKDANGVYTDSSGVQALTVDGNHIVVDYAVESTTVTTYYDKRLFIVGYLDVNEDGAIDGGDQQLFQNLMWIRVNDSETNFMMAELGDYFDDAGSNGSDDVIDSSTLTILNYNKTTGRMLFEYTSDSASAGTAASTQPLNPNMEVMRLYVAGSGDEAQILQFTGQSKVTENGYTAFAAYGPNGESSSSASVSAIYQKDDGIDDISGNVCVNLTNGSFANNLCGSHTNASDISAGLPAAVTSLRAMTGRLSAIAAKGIVEAGVDWTNATTRDNWLDQGESVSVSFDDITEMMTDTDGAPD